MTLVELAAVGAGVLMAAVVAFQVALAAGLPIGEVTMGGRADTEIVMANPLLSRGCSCTVDVR